MKKYRIKNKALKTKKARIEPFIQKVQYELLFNIHLRDY